MITKINTDIPSQTNKRIIKTLLKTHFWCHATDNYNLEVNINKADAGLALITHATDRPHTPNEVLNVYASFIFDIIQKNTVMKFKNILRYYWNWYSPSSKGTFFHKDETKDNIYSIIYNLHTNDGGTIFKINDEERFEKSVESQALIFPSKIEHMGVAPQKNLQRLNLNIILEI